MRTEDEIRVRITSLELEYKAMNEVIQQSFGELTSLDLDFMTHVLYEIDVLKWVLNKKEVGDENLGILL